MNKPTTPEELAAILKREFEAADDYHDQLEPLQEAAFRYYEAQPFGNELDGRSQIVLPDVQETIDAMLGVILKMFVSGDRVVEFEATNEEDEQAADDATAALDYVFMRQQDGYRVLNDFVLDALQRKLGIFKSTCIEDEKVSRQWFEIQDEAQLGMLPDDAEIEAEREGETGIRILVKTQRTIKRYTIVAVPTVEYRFTPTASHEDCADYQAHVRPVTRSELVEMGFDADQAYSLPAWSRELHDRQESNNLDNFNTEDSTPALEKVLLCEEYAHIDVDGDGIAELVKCFRVENEILNDADGTPSIETVDEPPFSVGTPYPRQHRLVGYSLADKGMDVQFLRSQLARQMIDGMAFNNMPRPLVDMSQTSDETLDDLLNPIPGSPVRTNGPSAVTPLASNFNVGDSLQAMEWVSREKEGRSNVGRATATLDENSMNPQTATEFAGREGKAEVGQEYIARNMAEALARAFGKLYRLMRVEAEPMRIKVDGKYRVIDPSTWPEDTHVRVNVGLGNGSKDRRIQARMALVGLMAQGTEIGEVGPEHRFNMIDGLARDMGIGQGDEYWSKPPEPEIDPVTGKPVPPPEKPDPEVMAKQAELQAKAQEAEARLQLDAQKAQAQAELDRDKAQAAIETEREKHAMDMQVARERAALEMELAREKTYAEIELAREKTGAEMALKRSQSDANMTDQRMGGSVAS